MKFARYTFLIAGIYGLLLVAPEYFTFQEYGQTYPPPVNHPEFYYGFVGLCLVFQLLFLLIAADPIRFRPVMLIAVCEKLCFVVPCAFLFAQHLIPNLILYFSLIDLLLAALFITAYLKTPKQL